MSKVVLTDFWAGWCGPCKVMGPIVDELEKEYAGKVEIRKVDLDNPANQSLVEQYQISSVPTFIVEKDEKVVGQLVGAQAKSALNELIKRAL